MPHWKFFHLGIYWNTDIFRGWGTTRVTCSKALVTGENVLGCCGDEHLKRCLNDLEVSSERWVSISGIWKKTWQTIAGISGKGEGNLIYLYFIICMWKRGHSHIVNGVMVSFMYPLRKCWVLGAIFYATSAFKVNEVWTILAVAAYQLGQNVPLNQLWKEKCEFTHNLKFLQWKM